jgi:hypothetical protein
MSSGGTSMTVALAGIAPRRVNAIEKTISAHIIRSAFFMSNPPINDYFGYACAQHERFVLILSYFGPVVNTFF